MMILPKSKITQQSIASHSYYKHVHVPNIFKASERVQANKDHRILRATDRNFVHYLCQITSKELIQSGKQLSEIMVANVAMNIYLQGNVSRISANIYSKGSLYLQEVHPTETISFVIQRKQSHSRQIDGDGKQLKGSTSSTCTSNSSLQFIVILYVIHYSEAWQQFCEQYSFHLQHSVTDIMLVTEYTMIAKRKTSGWLKCLQQQPLDMYIRNDMLRTNGKLSRIIQFENGLIDQLAKYGRQMNQRTKYGSNMLNHFQNTPFNEHVEFRRQLKLPTEQIQSFRSLQALVYARYVQLNPHKQTNKYFLDNLICRFMIAKEYNLEDSKQALEDYLQWECEMRRKYTYDSFADYHTMQIYIFIGKDFEGRPILINRPENSIVRNIVDHDRFVDFSLYMLEIYMQDMLEGYVDEMIALGGYGKIGYEHFSIDLLRKTVNLSDSYLPLRQKRLIAFDLNWVFYSVCNIIWPLLPNEIKERIKLFQNKEELKDYLKGIMDLNILPEDVLRG